MIDDSIEYRNIIMRCDRIEKTAYRNLSSDMEIEFFKEGMEAVWADVRKKQCHLARCSRKCSVCN